MLTAESRVLWREEVEDDVQSQHGEDEDEAEKEDALWPSSVRSDSEKLRKIPIFLRHFTFSRRNGKERKKTITMTYFDAKTADAEVSDRHDSRNDQEDGGHAEQ